MSILGWLRGLFRPKASPELRPLLEIRALYIEQVQQTENLRAAMRSLDLQIAEHSATVARWERRARLPLDVELRAAAFGILTRYTSYLASARAVRVDCERAMRACDRAQDSMLRHLTQLGGIAARMGLDTRPLAVEIDMTAVEKSAAERNARALIDEGICETDEERAFLEKLFERGLEARAS